MSKLKNLSYDKLIGMKKIIKPAYAHCDVPCGIYETDTLKHSAQTCLTLTTKALELVGDQGCCKSCHQLTRLVLHKEEHARLCKQQIYILWSDYFQVDHFRQHTELSDLLWLAARQCSTVKQQLSLEAAEKLVELASDIDHIFQKTRSR